MIDLSDDPEAQIQGQTSELLTEKQRAIEHVILKTFSNHGINVSISDKIRSLFRCKLWQMGQSLSKLGGSKRKQQVEEWKHTVWQLTIEVPQLLHQKHHLEQQLEKEISKRQKLEIESASLKKQVQSLDKISRDQAKTIVSLKTGKSHKQ